MKKETIEFALRTTWQQITNMYNEKAYEISLLILASLVIKADGKVRKEELNYVKEFFARTFGQAKSKRYLNFRAVIRKMTKKGKQNKLYSFKNFLSLTFDLKNCKQLIVIETGIKILIVFAKSYPNSKNEGVPNNSKPIPNID